MNQSHLPTLKEIETLTAYLPRLYAEGFSPVERWSGGEKGEDNAYRLLYPNYDPLVEEFFRQVSSDGWLDHQYNPEQAYQMLCDEAFVKTASLEQVRTMLTFCVRGERFSDGHWGVMLEKGYVRRLLERLKVIASEMGK